MKIVVVGDGKVGYALADQLNREGHDITVIDRDNKTLSNTANSLDVMVVRGSGASLDVQREAGVPGADLLIAATSMDEVNMLCCLTAKTLGAKNTIARIRDPEYGNQMHMLKEQFGLSLAINPELESARKIARVLKFPTALKVDVFSKGRAELVECKLPDDAPIVGKRLLDLPNQADTKILICAVDRDGEVHIPKGGFVLQAGDKLHITGENYNISAFLRSIGVIHPKIRSVLVVGGGRVAYYLAKMLDEKAFQLKIVEKDRARCNYLCEVLPRVPIIHGDGADFDLLESEGLGNMDAFVALTGIDEENLVMSMIAGYKKTPKTIAKVGRFNYLPLIEKMGVDCIVNPKMITVDQIIRYVRAMRNSHGGNIRTLYRIVDGKAETAEFIAQENTRHLGVTLDKIRLRGNILIGAIVRGERVIIPHGKVAIEKGDSVVVVTTHTRFTDLNDIFEE